MITSSNDYYKNLYLIQDSLTPQNIQLKALEPEKKIEINMNSRKISFQNNGFLSVAYDHKAETLVFEVDRYYDIWDLSKLQCVIQYTNAHGDSGIYVVPCYDLSVSGKILFPWCIEGSVTAYEGMVQFAVKFYKLAQTEDGKYYYLCNLNTLVSTGKVEHGLKIGNENYKEPIISMLEQVLNKLDQVEYSNEIYWLDV